MMPIAIYNENEGRGLQSKLYDSSELLLGYEVLLTSAIFWTEHEGPLEEARYLVINTKARRYTFTVPKLVAANTRFLLFSGLSDTDPSGTLRTLRKCYILIQLP